MKMWYRAMPWQGVSLDEVSARIIERAIELVHKTRPLLPGVRQALELCREQGLNIGLASASPLHMQQQVLKMFDLEAYFDQLVSAEYLPYSKPHPEVYLIAAERLGSDPLRCITLEDSFNGMIATKAARMRSIVIPAAEYRHDPRWATADHQLETPNSSPRPFCLTCGAGHRRPGFPLSAIKGSVQQNKRNSVSLLLNRHAVVIMLGDRESDGPRNVVTATQRSSRPPLPPDAAY